MALTQCWFTRVHVPRGRKHRQDDGSWTGHCRHCEREIVSWGKNRWYLADGFNVSRLAETSATRFLYLIDTADDFVVARFAVGHLADDAAIAALRESLAEEYLSGPGSADLELRDSREDA